MAFDIIHAKFLPGDIPMVTYYVYVSMYINIYIPVIIY